MTWTSRGLRGSTLEELINLTNEVYKEKKLAIIQKIPTPITPIKINKLDKTIALAYFNEKSTVDYIGSVQGIPICFDAKETNKDFLPLKNIHNHQIEFMKNFEEQQGISFILIFFKKYNEAYFISFKELEKYYQNSKLGQRKSIPYSLMNKNYLIKQKGKFLLHYLDILKKYIDNENLQ